MSFKIELLDQCPELPKDAPLFGSQSWWDFQKQVWGSQLRCLAVFDGQRLVSWMFFLSYGNWYKRLVPPPFQPEHGPYFINKNPVFSSKIKWEHKIVAAIAQFCQKQFHQTQIMTQGSMIRSAQWSGMKVNIQYTLLTKTEHYQPNSDIRRQIKKAQQAGFEFQAPQRQIRDLLKQNSDELRKTKNLHPYFVEQAAHFWELAQDLPYFQSLNICDSKQKLCAASLCAVDAQNAKAWNLLNPCLSSARKLGVSYLLYDSMICKLREQISTLDLTGADDPHVSYFKEQFAHHLELKHNAQIFSGPFAQTLWHLRN